ALWRHMPCSTTSPRGLTHHGDCRRRSGGSSAPPPDPQEARCSPRSPPTTTHRRSRRSHRREWPQGRPQHPLRAHHRHGPPASGARRTHRDDAASGVRPRLRCAGAAGAPGDRSHARSPATPQEILLGQAPARIRSRAAVRPARRRVPFDDTFVVDARPYVRQLAGIVDDTPPALIVLADGVSARLIALDASGVTDETVLQAEVPGRHESGGWADLARSRYERHILEHREQHFAAVAAAIGAWTERYDAHHIVLAAEPRSAAALRKHLPEAVAARIAGVVAGARTRARR